MSHVYNTYQPEEPLRPKGGGGIICALRTSSVCRATVEATLRRGLNYASSETEVTTNMSSVCPGKWVLGVGAAFKVNAIEQAFTWYPIRGSTTNTTEDIGTSFKFVRLF